ncbi:MAG: Do family serine endopeptidase [Planctomycetota bacterium]|jgi:hypothetical protein
MFRGLGLAGVIALSAGCPSASAVSPLNDDVIGAVGDSIVRVTYTLRFDKGEEPVGGTWRDPDDPDDVYAFPLEMLIAEERPAESVGFLVGPTTVATSDPRMHPRFIEAIHVEAAGQRVPAVIAATAIGTPAVMLELAAPLVGIAPLRFDPDRDEDLVAVSHRQVGAGWITGASPVGEMSIRRADGSRFQRVPYDVLIATKDGTPVGIAFSGTLEEDGSWRGAPTAWPQVDADGLAALLRSLAPLVDAQVVRVDLSFRSPSTSNRSPSMMMGFGEDADTEKSVAGIVTGDRRVLVLQLLDPAVTARLERIRVQLVDGPVDARFVGSLRDYGGFVADLEVAAASPAVASAALSTYRDELLVAADVRIQGTNRVATLAGSRIDGLSIGWRRNVYPDVVDDPGTSYLYDREGRLIAFPIARRLPPSLEDARGGFPKLTAAADLWTVLGDLDAHVDPGNVPLAEADEHRLAWFGVELQPLDRELARLYGVADQTGDGATGGLVVHVYDDSPAAEAGIALGDILLRIDVVGQPRPIEVNVEDAGQFGFGGGDYPWQHWDEMPEDVFNQIPPPWPPADSGLNRTLTDIGFGTAARVEFARDGVIGTTGLTITKAPAHFASAPRYEKDSLGLTVRDLTFEVRRYFQIAADEPGVIVTGLEKGSKASIGGLRPYELILSVDGTPVHDADAFGELISTPGEHRLAVQRMTQQRIVTLEVEQR